MYAAVSLKYRIEINIYLFRRIFHFHDSATLYLFLLRASEWWSASHLLFDCCYVFWTLWFFFFLFLNFYDRNEAESSACERCEAQSLFILVSIASANVSFCCLPLVLVDLSCRCIWTSGQNYSKIRWQDDWSQNTVDMKRTTDSNWNGMEKKKKIMNNLK